MQHRIAGRRLTRTPAHGLAMRRNLAQSLIEHGQIETTLPKAKELRRFVERLITVARRGDLRSRQRVLSILGDRAVIPGDQQERYESMSSTQRAKVLVARSGRRHRTGAVPAAYNKKKIPFVATSVVHKLMTEIAPRYKDRPGGYTRIIRLAKRRIGDNSSLAILQLVGDEEKPDANVRKVVGRRKLRTEKRKQMLKGATVKRARGGKKKSAESAGDAAAPTKPE
ncbi:MAG: 50S ribosomal protein L17 [Phycisphaerae bacterium]|nr:50S ribosomal protein L17 [Phycisphaerae bacterium]